MADGPLPAKRKQIQAVGRSRDGFDDLGWGLGFPKIRDTFLGVLIKKDLWYFGNLYWGPIILGDYHM